LHTIHRHKISLTGIFLLVSFGLFAQANLPQYDLKRLHFGFTISTNLSRIAIERKSNLIGLDTVKSVTHSGVPGIGLGAISNLHLGNNWDLRLLFPVINFVQRDLHYQFLSSEKTTAIESAYCDASLEIKFKSDRRKNLRLYVLTGGKISYDLGSTIDQKRSLTKPVVSLVPLTYGYEIGFGLDLYYEYFKLSPEIKFHSTFGNAMYRDGYIYTDILNGLSPQLIQISFHFEG